MRTLILTILATACINVCYGQNAYFLTPSPDFVIKNYHLGKKVLPQIQFRNGLHEQLDSTQLHQWRNAQDGWVTTETSHYTYTTDHRMASERVYFFDLNDAELYYGRQEEYFYNDSGKWNLHYRNFLDPVSGEWEKTDREELIYNDELPGTEFIRSTWDGNRNEYIYTFKSIFTYTPTHKAEGYISFSWDGNIWKESRKEINEYNSVDSLLRTTIYTWNDTSADWEIGYRLQYYYTNDIRLDSVIESSNSGFGLEPYQKIAQMYNAQDLLSLETGYQWDSVRWYPYFKNEYEYTPEAYLAVESSYEWDSEEETFVGNYREEHAYTPDGDYKVLSVSDFDTELQEWDRWFKREIFFDENVDGATIVWPNPPDYFPPSSFHHKPVYQVESIFELDQWFVIDTTVLFYSDITTATSPVSKLEISAFPNPASDQIYIQIENHDPDATIAFFDLQGRLITSNIFRANLPVNISMLVPGAYIFWIRNGADTYAGKILKE